MTLVERFTVKYKQNKTPSLYLSHSTTSLIHSSLYPLNQTWKSFRSPPIPTHSVSSAPVKWPKALPKAPSALASYPLLASKPPSTLTPLAVPPSSPSASPSFLQTTTYYSFPLNCFTIYYNCVAFSYYHFLILFFFFFPFCRLFVIVTSSSSRLNRNYVFLCFRISVSFMKEASWFY